MLTRGSCREVAGDLWIGLGYLLRIGGICRLTGLLAISAKQLER